MSILTMNINARVAVELEPEGLRILEEYYRPAIELAERDGIELTIPDLDGNIFITQLWDLMRIFGPHIKFGHPILMFKKNMIDIISES